MVEADGYHDCLEDWKENSTAEELKYDLAQVIKANCQEVVAMHGTDLALDYAMAFLDAVEWREIASHIVNDWMEEE